MSSKRRFNKRPAKTKNSLKRRGPNREEYDKVLIVCEGSKTEPIYFNELVSHHKLSTANVVVDGDCGSSPSCVLRKAKELYDEAVKRRDPYDRVYCVFDKDSHSTYSATLRSINDQAPVNTFFAVTSVPCFEFWLLLHHTYMTRPFSASHRHSASEMLIAELKTYMPGYTKASKGLYTSLKERLPAAIENSERVYKHSKQISEDNPSTNIHELVQYLLKIKKISGK